MDASEENTQGLVNGRSHPVELFTEDFLAKACANFKELLGDAEALTKHADNFVRAMYLPVSAVEAVLAQTKGEYVKLYYGVMDNTAGKHFMFMAPGDTPVTDGNPSTTVRPAMRTLVAQPQSVSFTVAVPECIGKIPPCPAVNDQFVQ